MFSYSNDPSTSPLDEVRFLIGDTDPSRPQMQDAEINYQIALVYGSVSSAPRSGNFLPAAYCADNIATRFAQMADKSIGDLHITYSQSFRNLQSLSQRLRTRATLAMVPVYAGGLSRTEKAANNKDGDRISTAAQIDGMDANLPLNNNSTFDPSTDS